MEIFGLICLVALYKFLDSPTPVEPVVVEVYQGVGRELEQ